jgi:hypothetical protein
LDRLGGFCPVSFYLPESSGDAAVRITSSPPGAAVLIDGAESGEVTPAEIPGLEAGTHDVRLLLDGYDDYSSSFVVAEDGDGSLHAILEEEVSEPPPPDGADGCWMFIELVERIPERTYEPVFENSASYSGGSGAVTYFEERGEASFTSTATWTAPPEILTPGEPVELPYAISMTASIPPSYYWDPGSYIGFCDSDPMEDPDPDYMGDGGYYDQIGISAVTNKEPKNEIAYFVPPDPWNRTGISYYVIKFYVRSAHFFYIYEWQPSSL